MRVQDVIRRPLITEKSQIQRDDTNTVAFEVDRRANKIDVKRAFIEVCDIDINRLRIDIAGAVFDLNNNRIGILRFVVERRTGFQS